MPLVAGGPYHGAQAGEGTLDVGPGGGFLQVPPRVVEQVVDFLFQRPGLERQSCHRGVRGADEYSAAPGDGEQDPAVVGLRHHDGGLARQERAVEHDVGALAGRNQGRAPGSSSRRISSALTPEAFTTVLVVTVNSSPVSRSRAIAPASRPPWRVKAVTGK